MPARKKTSVREQLAEYRRKRDFGRTAEPSGETGHAAKTDHKKLEFVIQKHAARNLHFDLRLELDGVMKSWAVPKGPSPDPATKRLAMQVEDHPVEYNEFEGTIPEGEYGGGTVMLWDRGWYAPESGEGEEAVRAGIAKGDLKVVFHGKRMKGSWVLVRTRGFGSSSKPSWLLIKHRDKHVDSPEALVETYTTSVVSKKTMEQIGGSKKSKVWHSNRPADDDDAPLATRKSRSLGEVRRARAKAAKKAE
ncbi:MAG TPA: DNA polymerase ligase N-terminal domain-containing protein [Gemmatimonadaceae bacterium]|nr:DNA polymerase ligase N-terminal domain-containing protein [Gemmatimonadaceae bacterium]